MCWVKRRLDTSSLMCPHIENESPILGWVFDHDVVLASIKHSSDKKVHRCWEESDWYATT